MRNIASKGLLFPVSTRWMSILIAYKRVLELYDHINIVAKKHRWNQITTTDRDSMQALVELLDPLLDVLLVWEKDGLTISSVYNGICALVEYYKVN